MGEPARKSDPRLGDLAAYLPYPVLVCDPAGAVLYHNPAAESLGAELALTAITGLLPGDHARRVRDSLVSGGGEVEVSVRERILVWTYSPARPLGLVYLSARNLSGPGLDEASQRLLVEQTQRHQLEMAHAARLITLGEMASGLAHELNQPLAAIVNYAQGCIRRIDASPPAPLEALRDGLERISRQASRAGEIIRRLRGFVRKGEFRRSPAPINELLLDMIHFCAPEARRHHVEIRSDLDPGLPPAAVDRVQIEQVILNLLRNAMEACHNSREGSGPITVVSSPLGERVRVTVSDRGHGLPDGEVEKLFEQFYTTKPKGLGMGLVISRSIIEAHGGRLWAEPNPGGGARFSFTLPACQPPEETP